MSYKITHIYRVDLGYNSKEIKFIEWVYARNADVAKAFCKEKYSKYKFNHIKAVMVGENKNYTSQKPSSLTSEEIRFIETTQVKSGDRYAYRRD